MVKPVKSSTCYTAMVVFICWFLFGDMISTSPLFKAPAFLAWIVVTVLIVTITIRYYIDCAGIKPRFSLKHCLLVVLWISIGISTERYSNILGIIDKENYQMDVYRLHERSDWVIHRLTREPLTTEQKISLSTVDTEQEVLELQEIIDNWLNSVEQLSLQSVTAQELRKVELARLDLIQQTAKNHAILLGSGHNEFPDWQKTEGVRKTLNDVTSHKHFPPAEGEEPAKDALMSVIRWPNLTEKQISSIAEWEARNPTNAKLLLIDMAIINAQKRLSRENPSLSYTEKDAREKLKNSPEIAALMDPIF